MSIIDVTLPKPGDRGSDYGGDWATKLVNAVLATFTELKQLPFNVKRYGAKGDGVTDDGPAIEAAIAAMVAQPGSNAAAGVLYFPPGRYIDSMQHVIPRERRIVVMGSSRATTELRRANGSIGDWWTFNAVESGMQHLSLDGRRYQCVQGGDNIVLNGAYTFAVDLFVNKANGTGLSVGKAADAVVHHVDRVRIRECRRYGAHVHPGFSSTDGIWNGLEVGLTGLSGLRLDTGSQNFTAAHLWGAGLESDTDNHGALVNSQSNTFINIQSETNNGDGVRTTGARNVFVGGRIWGNMKTGFRGIGANYLVLNGVEYYRNAAANGAAGSTSSLAFAAIYLTDTKFHTITGNNVWDDAVAFTSVEYTKPDGSAGAVGAPPTYPFAGRVAALSQVYAYAEDGDTDFGTIVGNTMPRQLTRGGVGPFAFADKNSHQVYGNQWGTGVTLPTRAVVDGAVRVPSEVDAILIAGASTINSVLGHRPGRRVTLIFTGPGNGTVTDSATLNLAGNLTTAPGVTLGLVSDGTKWYETGRSTT